MPKEEPEEVTIITTKDKIQTYIRQNYVSKKLIQDKIKELEEKSDYWNCDEIEVLKELLERR